LYVAVTSIIQDIKKLSNQKKITPSPYNGRRGRATIQGILSVPGIAGYE